MGSHLDNIIDKLRSGEKNCSQRKIGIEFEHFVVYEDSFDPVSYYGYEGIEATLRVLLQKAYTPIYHESNLIGLMSNDATITLEPGAQIEISVNPRNRINDIKSIYKSILDDIIMALPKGQAIVSFGYRPKGNIENIKIIPKKRYEHMTEYLSARGSHALHMMRNSASTQVSIDYFSQEDFGKKIVLANVLSPIIFAMLDNSPIAFGNINENIAFRCHIWNNCDDDRSRNTPGNYISYSYEDYARYLLNTPPILMPKADSLIYTKAAKYHELLSEFSIEDTIEHMMSMVFPHVRAKSYIEIRMADALPIDVALGYGALIKGLFYSKETINELLEKFKGVGFDEVRSINEQICLEGSKTYYKTNTVDTWFKGLIKMASYNLDEEERELLKPLNDIAHKGTLRERAIEKIQFVGLKEGLQYAIQKS